MNKKLLLFAGTTEGRLLAEALSERELDLSVFVATDYGKLVLPKRERLSVSAGRLDEAEIETLLRKEACGLVLDATHPYAEKATENIRIACEKTKTRYLRVLREDGHERKALNPGGSADAVVYVDRVSEAVEFLRKTDGKILVTTGVRELSKFTALPDYQSRVFARVLPSSESVSACEKLDITGPRLIAMQGPFSEEMNLAVLRQTDAAWMVTKESGCAGGFSEKLSAAKRAGVRTLVIRRPRETGVSVDEALKTVDELLDGAAAPHETTAKLSKTTARLSEAAPPPLSVTLIGAGPGSLDLLTKEAETALASCDLIAGAERMAEQVSRFRKPVLKEYRPEAVLDYLERHPEYRRVAVVLSGDTGFYSGAGRLLQAFSGKRNVDVRVLCGISSMAYFFAKIGRSWEHVKFLSLHGREENLVYEVMNSRETFVILGGQDAGKKLCETLLDAGLSQVLLTFGENLTLPGERFYEGTPGALKEQDCGPLTVVLIENPDAGKQAVTHGMEDDMFLRGDVPMTKMEVRSVSISKLRLTRQAVVWDVGAGTGSVAVECAKICGSGTVYAVERKPEALALLEANRKKFGLSNLKIVSGAAPEALYNLPAPTHVFIGGSGGGMEAILCAILKKNPSARVVVNAITLETLAELTTVLKRLLVTDVEVVLLTAARDKKAGPYRLMTGQNPVHIISFSGSGNENTREVGTDG